MDRSASSSYDPGTSSASFEPLIPSKYKYRTVTINGVQRKLAYTDSSQNTRQGEADPKTIELITRFLTSQGLSLECAREPAFMNLVRYLSRDCQIPSQFEMKTFLTKTTESMKQRPIVHFQRGCGPLGLTIDYIGTDQKYLVYSIHWFKEISERQNIVYFRRLSLADIQDSGSLLIPPRESVDSTSFGTVKFSSIVLPNEEAFKLVIDSRVGKRYYICFHYHMTSFVKQLMNIYEFGRGLTQLKDLVRFIRERVQFYAIFRKIKVARNMKHDVPVIKNEQSWEETFLFLTNCLAMHDVFYDYADEIGYPNYISNSTFNYLIYFQRLLQQCINICKELSQSGNSISQAIPKIIDLKNYILSSKMGYRFEYTVQELMMSVFHNITHGLSHYMYETASLFDPRYAYGKTFSEEKWLNLEKRVVDEFTRLGENNYNNIYPKSTCDQRSKFIKENFAIFRQMLSLGVDAEEDPFHWWGQRHKAMETLSNVARQYLASPATSVNASTYFGSNGKFDHICESVTFQDLDIYLNNAGVQQRYVGKGAYEKEIAPELAESLRITACRMHQHYETSMKDTLYVPRTQLKDPRLLGQDSANAFESKSSTLSNNKRPVALFPVQLISNPNAQNRSMSPYSNVPTQLKKPTRPLGNQPALSAALFGLKTSNSNRPAGAADQQVSKETKCFSEERKPMDLLEQITSFVEIEKEVKEEIIEEDEMLAESFGESVLPSPSTSATPQLRRVFHRPTHQGPSTSTPALLPIKKLIRVSNPGPNGATRQVSSKIGTGTASKTASRTPPMKFPVALTGKPSGPLHLPSTSQHCPIEEKPTDIALTKPDTHKSAGLFEVKDEIAEVAEMLDDTEGLGKIYDEALEYSASLNMPKQRHRDIHNSRRCCICTGVEKDEHLKNVTMDNEKLLLILGCVFRKEISMIDAHEFLTRPAKTYVCHFHFKETIDTLYDRLQITCPDDIHKCSADILEKTFRSMRELRAHTTFTQYIKILHDFAERYDHMRRPSKQDLLDYYTTLVEPSSDEPIVEAVEEEIKPKKLRQPRKQVLEIDQHDKTVKVIEKDEFQLPNEKQDTTGNEDIEFPATCRYCSKQYSRLSMIPVPRGTDIRARWVAKLGPEFEKRLQPDENFVCREHFAQEAFGTRGRLSKGSMPMAETEKVEITYKIQGNDFLKLNEEKSGENMTASIDLEKVQKKTKVVKNAKRKTEKPSNSKDDDSSTDESTSRPERNRRAPKRLTSPEPPNEEPAIISKKPRRRQTKNPGIAWEFTGGVVPSSSYHPEQLNSLV
ncbi:hypothetical protein L5515_019050 [Caenorhabditis briggsae]|uniref:THAP-type domain-containing protein n=2 Tax=Caenorhabditis briggsae TaxID=6238 RepID=A0AAE9FHC4_CAEBR|nr:hypothetical protein L5515_019050 [Caenorhabditis briggsae]